MTTTQITIVLVDAESGTWYDAGGYLVASGVRREPDMSRPELLDALRPAVEGHLRHLGETDADVVVVDPGEAFRSARPGARALTDVRAGDPGAETLVHYTLRAGDLVGRTGEIA